jgi:hypothetical protein
MNDESPNAEQRTRQDFYALFAITLCRDQKIEVLVTYLRETRFGVTRRPGSIPQKISRKRVLVLPTGSFQEAEVAHQWRRLKRHEGGLPAASPDSVNKNQRRLIR